MILEPLQKILTTAFPDADLQIANERVVAAESRLNLLLPEPLKELFSVAGGSRDILNADFRIYMPEKLHVEGDHLIFCEENQGLEAYGIPLESLQATMQPDPQVDVRRMHAKSWAREAQSLSAFMLGLAAWQVLLAVPESARCPYPEDELAKLLQFFEPLGASPPQFEGPRFGFLDRRNSIIAAYEFSSGMLYLGSPLEDVLDELAENVGLDLDSL